MKKREIVDEISAQISELKREIRDLKIEIQKLTESKSAVTVVGGGSGPFVFQKLPGTVCPSCNLDVSKSNICCMSTNCPYRMEVSCSVGST